MREPIVNHMTFYPSFREAIDALPDDRERLEAYDMLTDYGIYGEDPAEDISGALRLIFTLAKPNIDNARKKVLDGQKGGRPKKSTVEKTRFKPVEKPVDSSNIDKDIDIDGDKEMDIESLYPTSINKDEEGRASSPANADEASPLFTLNEFREEARTRNIDLSDDEIVKCYQANRRKGFEPPKGRKTFSIFGALRGWEKFNGIKPAPAPDPEPAPSPKPKPKPKSKDEQIMEISRDYIPDELLAKYPDAKRTLTGAFCPKSAFLDRDRGDLIEYLKDCGVWLSNSPMGTESPIYQNKIANKEG